MGQVSQTSRHAGEKYKAYGQTPPRPFGRLEAWSLKINLFPPGHFWKLEAQGQKLWPPGRGIELSKQWSHVRVTWNTGSYPPPPENLRKTLLGHEPCSAQRKDWKPEDLKLVLSLQVYPWEVNPPSGLSFLIYYLQTETQTHIVIKPLYSNVSIEGEQQLLSPPWPQKKV